MKTTNNFTTKSALRRKKRNEDICAEFEAIMSRYPSASVMVVRQSIADKYNMSISSVANITKNGQNSPQR